MIKNIYKNPARTDWQQLQQRPGKDNALVLQTAASIIAAVKRDGDAALQYYAKKFDNNPSANFLVPTSEIEAAADELSASLKKAIGIAKENITKFHLSQLKEEPVVETMPGIRCWRKSKAIQKVGLYIPGGTAPLFSTVLMLAIPAQLAGCNEIILCTPPSALESEERLERAIHPAILYTASLCGITKIYKLGGAAAIAAMAYGTTTVPAVYKIFGPGNAYVTAAKQLVQMDGIAIDMPAGPSEVCILADASAIPDFVAADLLSQAEHGNDSQVMLVTLPGFEVEKLQEALTIQTQALPRQTIATNALENSKIICFEQLSEALDFINTYAPEHLILSCGDAISLSEFIENAGSVFIGNYSPESVGDYASGTNHTLPTNGFAKQYSGVSMDSFVKKITFQQLTKEGLKNIADTVITMAEEEQLLGHANAIKIRQNEF